jgi:hypothetical protein
MDRRRALAILAAVSIPCNTFPRLAAQCIDSASPDKSLWVEKVVERMQSIKPGMTRKQLLTVFTPEGGISEVDRRTYRSQDCLYFAVDVKFHSGELENPQERILTISPPYLKMSFVTD